MEVYRPEVGKPIICADDPSVVAVASTMKLDVTIPQLDLNDVEAIAEFVINFCELPAEQRHGAA